MLLADIWRNKVVCESMSVLLQMKLTHVNGPNCIQVKIGHKKSLVDADVILINDGRQH